MPQQRETTPEQYAALEPDKVLQTMQIIAGALMAGVVMFSAVASFIVFGQPKVAQPGGLLAVPQINSDLLIYMALGCAILNTIMSFVVPNLISGAGMKGIAKMAQDGTSTGSKELFGRLLGVAQTKMIIALALIEGAAFFSLVMFLSTKSATLLAIVGALLLVMAIHFPTKIRLARWVEDQQRMLS